MKNLLPSLLLLCSWLSSMTAAEIDFFAMDNGLHDVKSIAGKADLLKELGYDGVTWRPGHTAEAVREMTSRGLRIHALKIRLPVSKDEEPPRFPLADLKAVEGTGALLWVTLLSQGGSDIDAVRSLRQLNAVASPLGLRIAIYPHVDTHAESLEDALRIADLVAHEKIGVSLTLCHQLKHQGLQDLGPLLKKALPKLFLVLVSGAENGDTKAMGWDKLIQPLGQGSYDVRNLVQTLRKLRYQGPVGVIGFGLKQPAKEHLKQSIDFWRSACKPSSALVFLIAGQSNAGGVAAFSPETNVKSGMAGKHPTIPGSTAKEIGIPLNGEGYPRSFIWKDAGFVPLIPGSGYYVSPYPSDPKRHGIELPMAMLLQKHFPTNDICFVKFGPGGHNLHTQWKAGKGPDYNAFMGQFIPAMADLKKRYEKVRVIGLYWDQGESDVSHAAEYQQNLTSLFIALRRDLDTPDLQIYVRKMMFNEQYLPISTAQTTVTEADPQAHLLDLDLGSNEKNFKAWAWSDKNGHLSSKAYLELSRMILALSKKGDRSLNSSGK